MTQERYRDPVQYVMYITIYYSQQRVDAGISYPQIIRCEAHLTNRVIVQIPTLIIDLLRCNSLSLSLLSLLLTFIVIAACCVYISTPTISIFDDFNELEWYVSLCITPRLDEMMTTILLFFLGGTPV